MNLNTPIAFAINFDLTTTHNIDQHNTTKSIGRMISGFVEGTILPTNNIPRVMIVSPVLNILSICCAQTLHTENNWAGKSKKEQNMNIILNTIAI